MFLIEAIGWAGMACVLYAFWDASHRHAVDARYYTFNFFGAAFLFLNALAHQALPLEALNVAWLLIALNGGLRAASDH